MKHVIESKVVKDVLSSRIESLESKIDVHKSNLNTIEQNIGLFLGHVISSQGFEMFYNFTSRGDSSKSIVLENYIKYELSKKHESKFNSIYVSVRSEDDFGFKPTSQHKFTLNNKEFCFELGLDGEYHSLRETQKKLQEIYEKCDSVKEFILDDKEYYFIFSE